MALIPPDAGMLVRLQNQAGSQPQPVVPLPEIPSDLPELNVGQAFTARIQEEMPQNIYKALVAGKFVTLQLPEGAKPGDTLELVVVDRTPRMLVAQLAGQPSAPAVANDAYPHATLSRAAQLISGLLLKEGEAPQPAPLNRGQPLLSQPPARGSDLVPVLAKAVSQSGVFYEAHQAQWVAGRMPLQQLLQEPQAQRSAPAVLAQLFQPPAHEARLFQSQPPLFQSPLPQLQPSQFQPPQAQGPMEGEAALLPAGREPLHTGRETTSLPQNVAGADRRSEYVSSQTQASMLAHSVPDELRPLVQQQLDAVATQRLVWHGEAWPNQPLEWEIVEERDQRTGADDAEERASWSTRLRLDTPRLGHVDASLRLTAAGIHIAIAASAGSTASDLQGGMPELAASLEAAGVPLLSFAVKHESAG